MTEKIHDQMQQLYRNYPEQPFYNVGSKREEWLREVAFTKSKLVPKRNMERLPNGLLAGDIILLWRIHFGTFTSEIVEKNWFPKYFEYTYGIDAAKHLEQLVEQEYVLIESATHSLEHVSSPELKHYLKAKGIKGFSKLKKDELQQLVAQTYSEEELQDLVLIRAYRLTKKGEQALQEGEEVVARHPKKNLS